MARVNVYVPDELDATVRSKLPDINVSQVLQRGLQAALECRHARLVCSECAFPVDHRELIDAALSKFFIDLLWALRNLVDRGGTAEGAARIAKQIAMQHQVSAAKNAPLPRPSRAQRHANKVVDWFDARSA